MGNINVAIIIGVSEYDNVAKLDGCKNDFRLMSNLIKATKKYDKILEIGEKTSSTEVKENLSNFFQELKTYNVQELFFYYSGHGSFDGQDLRYIFSDYSQDKLNSTTITNEFIDQQIRSINPKLTVKVVDACNSGVAYIKEIEEISNMFDMKKDLNNCYFMFSSHTNQYSYVKNLSYFTKSFAEAVINYSGTEIGYTSIIEYIKDEFSSKSDQTPYFVSQGSMTDIFCSIDDKIKNIKLSDYETEPVIERKESVSLLEVIRERSKSYISKEEIENLLEDITVVLIDRIKTQEIEDMFELNVEKNINYSKVSNIKAIAKWADETKNDFFIKVEKKEVEITDTDTNAFAALQKWLQKFEAVNITTDLDINFNNLMIKANPKFLSLLPYQCDVVFLISKYNIRIFYKFISFRETGWNIYQHSNMTKWESFEFMYSDYEKNKEQINKISDEFNFYIINDIKKTHGVLE